MAAARDGVHHERAERQHLFRALIPAAIAAATAVIGLLFVPETKDRDIFCGRLRFESRRHGGGVRSERRGLLSWAYLVEPDGPAERRGGGRAGTCWPRLLAAGSAPRRAVAGLADLSIAPPNPHPACRGSCNINCAAGEKARARISSVMTSAAIPDAARIMATMMNW
jgi:hypothetical protein